MTPDKDTPEREARVENLLRRAAPIERAPARLRLQVDDLHLYGAQRGGSLDLKWLGTKPRRFAETALAIVAAAAVALVLAMSGGTSPSIAAAASLAQRGPSAPAPAPYGNAPQSLLNVHVGNLRFPNWEHSLGWRAIGRRTDGLGDRSVTTVYYVKDGRQVAYSIVSSPVLRGFRPAAGERHQTLSEHGRSIVVWKERGHTCILSGAGISARTLWGLIA